MASPRDAYRLADMLGDGIGPEIVPGIALAVRLATERSGVGLEPVGVAVVVGGPGLAPGLNTGRDGAMAQATHGSAPDIAGTGVANPAALMLSGAMLLRWMAAVHADPRRASAGALLDAAVMRTVAEPSCRTPDLGGATRTHAFAAAVARSVGKHALEERAP